MDRLIRFLAELNSTETSGNDTSSDALVNAINVIPGINITNSTPASSTSGGKNTTDRHGRVSYNDTEIIINTLQVYGVIFFVMMTAFCILRVHCNRIFNLRSWLPEIKCDMADTKYNYISWIWKVYEFTDEDIFENCGMDALCYVRAMRFGSKLGMLGTLNAIWLIPCYATAVVTKETDYLEDGLAKISTANLSSSSPRFLATVIAAYITFLYAMHLIMHELAWYTTWRHKFLALREARNYALYVSGIPCSYRSSYKLGLYFTCCAPESVLEAHVAMNIPDLEGKQRRRNALITKLEHTVALEAKTGKLQYYRKFSNIFKRIPAVASYEKELTLLNKSIPMAIHAIRDAIETPDDDDEERQHHIERTSRNRDLFMYKDGADDEEEVGLRESLRRNIKLNVAAITEGNEDEEDAEEDKAVFQVSPSSRHFSVTRPSSARSEETPPDQYLSLLAQPEVDMTAADPLTPQSDASDMTVLFTREESKDSLDNDIGRSTHSESSKSSAIVHGTKKAVSSLLNVSKIVGHTIKENVTVDSVIDEGARIGKTALNIGAAIGASAGAVLPILVPKSEGQPRSAGFIVFKDLYTKHVMLESLAHPTPYTMEMMPAPEPGSIYWPNVGLPRRARIIGGTLSLAVTIMLCFFWSIPVAIISSFTEVQSLKETLPALGRYIEANPRAANAMEQVAPILIVIITKALLPPLLRQVCKWEGLISNALLEASLFTKLGWLEIVQTFFVSAISGGVTAELTNMINNPGEIVEFLANSLPTRSSFFIQLILVSTFISIILELLRIMPLIHASLRRCIGPRLTRKERRKRWLFLYALEDPAQFWQPQTFSRLILIFVVFFVYAVIAPITAIFVHFCFILLESTYRYQFIHNFPRVHETGGELWFVFLRFILASMVIAQLTLIGLLTLKQSKFAGPSLIPLLIFTVIFAYYVTSRHMYVTKYLPLRNCIVKDRENEEDNDFSFVQDKYIQTALRTYHKEAEYEFDSDEDKDGNDDDDDDYVNNETGESHDKSDRSEDSSSS